LALFFSLVFFVAAIVVFLGRRFIRRCRLFSSPSLFKTTPHRQFFKNIPINLRHHY
jgi:hypothetical protein